MVRLAKNDPYQVRTNSASYTHYIAQRGFTKSDYLKFTRGSGWQETSGSFHGGYEGAATEDNTGKGVPAAQKGATDEGNFG